MTTSDDELCYATASHMAKSLRTGKISSQELTSAYFGRIERLDGNTRSYACLMLQSAEEEAVRADRELSSGLDRGPLHGIPVAVKDLIDSKGVCTAAGMAIRSDNVPDSDGTVLRRLREAGAVVLGKLTLTEGATGSHHPSIEVPLNPWNANHSSGFSSSGSGVAVAAGLCAAALGSDTGGSIRIPSAFNGVTGLKPTWGRVSRHGVFPLVEYLDTIGPMARSAADAAAVLGAIAGADPADPTAASQPVPNYAGNIARGISGMAIGVDWSRIDADCGSGVRQGLRHAAEVLAAKGARIRDVCLPSIDIPKMMPLMSIGIADAHRDTYPLRAADYGPAIKHMLDAAAGIDGKDIAAAINAANALRAQVSRLFDEVELLLLPAMVEPAPLAGILENALADDFDAFTRHFFYTIPFNVTGSPTITFPVGFDNGLPVAAQLVGPHFSEELLFQAGYAFQSVTDWHLERPPLPQELG